MAAFALTIVSATFASSSTGTPFFSGIKTSFPDSIRPVISDPHVQVVRYALTTSEHNAILQFSISLRTPNFDELEARIANGEQIAPDAMAARYLPSALDYAAVETWLQGQGFTVSTEDPNHTSISASGTVAQIENSLGVNFARVATADGQFTSAISAPNLPVELAGAVLAVNGLQPHLRMHHFRISVLPDTVSFFSPPDILAAYNAPSNFDGTGQTIAIIMDAPVLTSDLSSFYTDVGSTAKTANFTTVLVDGGTSSTADADESTLDVEWSSAIAPGAKVRLYEVPDLSFSHLHDACTKILADAAANKITVVSFSAGAPEIASGITASNVAANTNDFALLAAAGISVFISSGDGGSNPDSSGASNGYVASDIIEVNYPASDVNVAGVGGTNLTFTSSSFSYGSEAVFSDISGGLGNASSGGVSSIFTKPTWQVDGVTGSILSINTKRCVPDVSMVWGATQGSTSLAALIILNGASVGIGGTSLSSPIWAGVAAITNQARASIGGTTLGLLGPSIYPLNISTPSVFHDVTTGNNGAFTAVVGYDLCTGLGSPNIGNLISPLTAVFPTITQQPQSVTVNVGASINLFVQATSSAGNNTNLSYLWFKNGVSTGITTQNYSIFSVTAANAGAYNVAVTDSLGTTTSATATVIVNSPAPAASSGGGGALSYWFYLALAMLFAIRKVRSTRANEMGL
ncbi:MAG TPA: protease pro-enzyme activation domain-containing protein [Opitutaceae bacterium]|nr:protease pro-enzyme activation domain-containing protein [Opitutaceae bacterium]